MHQLSEVRVAKIRLQIQETIFKLCQGHKYGRDKDCPTKNLLMCFKNDIISNKKGHIPEVSLIHIHHIHSRDTKIKLFASNPSFTMVRQFCA